MLIEVICEKRERGRGGGRTKSREEVVIIHPITITTTINNNNDNTLDEINNKLERSARWLKRSFELPQRSVIETIKYFGLVSTH